MNATDWWAVVVGPVGALGIIGVLLRISYQMGAFVTEFRAYVKLNDRVVRKLTGRVGRLEKGRRFPGK